MDGGDDELERYELGEEPRSGPELTEYESLSESSQGPRMPWTLEPGGSWPRSSAID